jgi:hypothetical protein
MLAWGSIGGSVIRFASRRPIGSVAQQRLIRVLALLRVRAHVVLAVDHLAAFRIDHDVVGHVIGMPFVLIVAAVAARNDGFCGIELGFDRPRGRAVACREFGHRGIGLDREARVHVGLPAGIADFPTTQTLPYVI